MRWTRLWVGGVVAGLLLVALGCLIAAAVGSCGDGSCEGHETPAGCPQDCGDLVPNPLRAVVSEDILTWQDWMDDGGFERGDEAVELLAHPVRRLASASVERCADAARSGGYGMRISADVDEGIVFAVRAKIEKGEQTRCSFWARSVGDRTDLRVSVLGVESGRDEPRVLYSLEPPSSLGLEWSQLQFAFVNTHGVKYALLALEIGPNTALDVDDVAVEAEQWALPRICRFERSVGGIPVPFKPIAPIHFNVLIHVEDPALITQREAYFREKTAVFTELARLLHEHGGFLTIQPEEDWPMAALRFAPETLIELAQRYGVVYSTHTHGPACVDPEGRLRSSQDCRNCRDLSGCQQIETDTDPYTPQYVGALRELIAQVSRTEVTDHNGNFHYANVSALADVGIATWSAFKDHNTQSTFDRLFTNPWRPTACDAIASPETFQIHDPSTSVVFVPGWGQAITRHPERLHDRLAGMLSRILCYADAHRVNTFYIVTHVDHYGPEAEEPYIAFDEVTGELTLHDGFSRDLGYWEETLSELIDPLVAEGYLVWTSLPDIGKLFVNWEAAE